jgi:hypothetical protein
VLISSIAGLGAAAVACLRRLKGRACRTWPVALGERARYPSHIVAPGLADTPLGRLASAGRPARARTRTPFGRQATAGEIAYAALFFRSDESVYVTAQVLAVDSGLTGIS